MKLNEKHVPESIGLNDAATNHDNNHNHNHANHANHDDDNDNDDDAESVSSSISSGNPTAFKHPRSIAKQNQIKYLKDGMRLRHAILANAWDHWHATFHAETNRIIALRMGWRLTRCASLPACIATKFCPTTHCIQPTCGPIRSSCIRAMQTDNGIRLPI